MSPAMYRVAKNVRRYRLARGWTQQRLADGVGTGRIYIAQIEKPSKEISLEMLGRLAKSFRVSLASLVK